MKATFLGVLLGVFGALLAACSSCQNNDQNSQTTDSNDTESSPDTESSDASSDSDTSTDADADTDTDVDVDNDSDSDTDSDTDNDGDADSDNDTDIDTDTETGTSPSTDIDLPVGCEIIKPANENGFGWRGNGAMDEDHMVWRWIDETSNKSQSVLMARTLSTGEQKEIIRRNYPEVTDNPVTNGKDIFFERIMTPEDGHSGEVFSVPIIGSSENRVTDNNAADCSIWPGNKDIVHYSTLPANAGFDYMRIVFTNLSTKISKNIIDDNVSSFTFNGDKWVLFFAFSGYPDEYVYRFDISNPDKGIEKLYDKPLGEFGSSFDKNTTRLITSLWVTGVTNGYDMWLWNIETGEHSVLIGDEWDQGLPAFNGNVVAYLDTLEVKARWFGNHVAQVKIMDVETKAKRTVFDYIDQYFGLALWSHYLAFNNMGKWGDSIILCDLEKGGFMDAEGHVIP